MNKKLLAMFLIIPLLCLIVWAGHLEYQKQTGYIIKLPITGYDPRDLFSGHYINYQIDWEKAKCEYGNCDYLNKDAFCQKKVCKVCKGCKNRFYIPEEYAQKLDELFQAKNKKDMTFEIIYSYTGKRAYATQFLINGKDYKEFLENN